MIKFPELNSCTLAVIGLGYVGLPLAVEFAKPQSCRRTGAPLQRQVIGFDIAPQRLSELKQGIDRTNEISSEELSAAKLLVFTSDLAQLAAADVFVVTVPTPIDNAKRPDLTPLENASVTVGQALKLRAAKGAATTPLVIYESTVYPGATEEVCVPILERESGLHFNAVASGLGFVCGYSPERINPGDTEHKLVTITKVTSGSTTEAAEWVDALYGSIIEAGTHLAPSLKVAEAAKVIENTQRDLNIALVNELAIIFRHMEIDTLDVLEAAGSKWNFLPFRPGLVGGHCIGVDPYYLTYKAEQLGYYPHVVLAGRRINDSMSGWVVDQLILAMAKNSINISKSEVLLLGFTFKENCPDIRNSKCVDLIHSLQRYDILVTVVDPWVNPKEASMHNGISVLTAIPECKKYSVIIAAVGHDEFKTLTAEQWSSLIKDDGIMIDLKNIVPRSLNPIRI